MSHGRPVSLNTCSIIEQPLEAPIHLEVTGRQSRGERRRRSLRRGIDLWLADAHARARTRRPVLLLALTFADADPLAARGAIVYFWQQFRKAFGKRFYFSWAELQAREAVHYHALIYDPPWTLRRHARRWVEAHWPHARIQPSVDFRDNTWWMSKAGSYVKAYAKGKQSRASPGKAYQQDYDLLPREIRTWECNRLGHTVKELANHTDRAIVVNTNPFAPWSIKRLHYWLIARGEHTTPPRRLVYSGQNQRAPEPV